MNREIIRTKNLMYTYATGTHALRGISLDINEGEKVALMGANGSGKSTFFLNINGVLEPDSGEIFLRGEKITKKNKNELRRKVGIVFQDADSQIVASTVFGEVSFGPMNLKLPKEEVKERVEKALSYMNISQYRSRPPHYLSGGEKKRVSIADIIAMQPEMIIFDEPSAALDPGSVEMLNQVLERLADQNMTLLISTHDVDFAYAWAKRIIVFDKGKIIADDTPENIFLREDILQQARLKQPVLLQVAGLMKERNLLGEQDYPKTFEQLKEQMDSFR